MWMPLCHCALTRLWAQHGPLGLHVTPELMVLPGVYPLPWILSPWLLLSPYFHFSTCIKSSFLRNLVTMDWLGHDQAYFSLSPYPLSMTLFNRGQTQICNWIQEQQAGKGAKSIKSCWTALKPSCSDAILNKKERGCYNGCERVKLGALRPRSRSWVLPESQVTSLLSATFCHLYNDRIRRHSQGFFSSEILGLNITRAKIFEWPLSMRKRFTFCHSKFLNTNLALGWLKLSSEC